MARILSLNSFYEPGEPILEGILGCGQGLSGVNGKGLRLLFFLTDLEDSESFVDIGDIETLVDFGVIDGELSYTSLKVAVALSEEGRKLSSLASDSSTGEAASLSAKGSSSRIGVIGTGASGRKYAPNGGRIITVCL